MLSCPACVCACAHMRWPMNGQIWGGNERRGDKIIPWQGEFLAAMRGTQQRCPKGWWDALIRDGGTRLLRICRRSFPLHVFIYLPFSIHLSRPLLLCRSSCFLCLCCSFSKLRSRQACRSNAVTLHENGSLSPPPPLVECHLKPINRERKGLHGSTSALTYWTHTTIWIFPKSELNTLQQTFLQTAFAKTGSR